MPDDHFSREAQVGSACLCRPLAGAYLGKPAGGRLGRSVALVANLRAGCLSPPEICFGISRVNGCTPRPHATSSRDLPLPAGALAQPNSGVPRRGLRSSSVLTASRSVNDDEVSKASFLGYVNSGFVRVRNLQRLMLRSRANTLLSVRRVTERDAGRMTAGGDG